MLPTIEHKLSRGQLQTVADMLQDYEYTPQNECEVIQQSILQQLRLSFGKKLLGKPQTFTLSLQRHEAIALKKFLAAVANHEGTDSIEGNTAYQMASSLGSKTTLLTPGKLQQGLGSAAKPYTIKP